MEKKLGFLCIWDHRVYAADPFKSKKLRKA